MVNHQEQAINKQLLTGWTILVAALLATHLLKIVHFSDTEAHFYGFIPILTVPLLAAFITYLRDSNSTALKYIICFAYFLFYFYEFLTGDTFLVFVYAFPIASLLILYHRERLVLFIGLVSFAMNAVYIAIHMANHDPVYEHNSVAEIQLASIFLVFLFSYFAARLYGSIHAENTAYMVALNEKSRELEEMTMQTVTAIAGTIDAKDSYTEGHSLRVAEYSRALAKSMGKDVAECDRIYHIALLHDIGKIGIPDSVLHKPGRLNPEEYEMIKQHPEIGARILKDVKAFPGLEVGALYHHERYDGTGYPCGLAGDQIPEIARIICVADTFDAMNTNRVYRKRFTKEHIIEELKRCSGTQFDPAVAEKMIWLIENGLVDEIEKRTFVLDRRSAAEPSDGNPSLTGLSSALTARLAGEHSEKYLLDSLAAKETFDMVEADISDALEKQDGCMLLVDVDDMGSLNQSHGLLKGDFILAEIAHYLINDDNGMPVCRLEGDEFLCYISEVSSVDNARDKVSALKAGLQKHLAELYDFPVNVSIGAACSLSTGRKFASLLYAAEKALYTVKQNGKNSYMLYTPGALEPGATDKTVMERDLDNIAAVIEHKDSYSGAMKVEFSEFGQVYELLRNIGIRNSQKMQLVLFTIEFGNDADIHISERSRVMSYLDRAIANSVRKVDVTTRYSSTQQLALFSNLPSENIQIVTDRIIKEFYCMVPESKFQVIYAFRTIGNDAA